MSTVQTTYTLYPGAGYAGNIFGSAPTEITDGLASAPVEFGTAVMRTAVGSDSVSPADGTQSLIGIAIRKNWMEYSARGQETLRYEIDSKVEILRSGSIYVNVSTGCQIGEQVTYSVADGSLSNTPADASNILIDGASFETNTVAGGLAVVRIK